MRGTDSRVVNLSSLAHRFAASIHFDDLNWQHRYKAYSAYSQSKLAMLMFAFELQRRSDAQAWGVLSLAAQPGLAATALGSNGPRLGKHGKVSWLESFGSWLWSGLAQSPGDGALPTLFAATSPDASKAGYYGPTGFMEFRGSVGEAKVAMYARDLAVAAKLWEVSESLTKVHWPTAPHGAT